jgi:hypothetical protein
LSGKYILNIRVINLSFGLRNVSKRFSEQLQAVSSLLGYLALCLLFPTKKVNKSIIMGFLESVDISGATLRFIALRLLTV